ncbi:hypothetical protein D3C78_1541790 [compost metagenome]
MTGTGHRHVQAALTPRAVKRTEVHRHQARGIRAVGDGEVNDVALVALNALQVLHEHWFEFAVGEVAFQHRILAALVIQEVLDQPLLFAIESHHTKGELVLADFRATQTSNQIGNQGPCLGEVGTRAALVVNALYRMQADSPVICDR